MRAEEKRQQARHKKKRHKRSRKGRRGRLTSADKLKLAQRTRADVLEEIDRWWQAGQSCFTKLLKKMKLQPRAESILDKVMPAPAKAEIQGDTVLVWCDKVPEPAAVRYGWADCPVVNLWNKDGLPASPFRTDDFPGKTAPKRDQK